jgi:hypothetical protein
MHMRFLPLLLLAAIPACDLDFEQPAAGEPLDPDRLNILFVGNSLTSTNLLPEMVEALLDSAGAGPVEVRAEAISDFGLRDHWFAGDVRTSVEAGGWDFVVLQQGPSATTGRPSLLEYSERFGLLIRANGATPALYMVWPSIDQQSDWDGVRESYRLAADTAVGIFLPSGDAWRVAWETDSTWQFYSSDGFHPTILGTYLAALVIVERLAGVSPIGLPARFELESGPIVSVTPTRADSLQVFAREANVRNSR